MRISERFGDVLFLSIVAFSVCDVIPPGMTFFPARLRLSFSNKPTRITVYPSQNPIKINVCVSVRQSVTLFNFGGLDLR